MAKLISSAQNKSIKELVRLQEKSRVRRREEKFVVEGKQEIDLALQSGYHFRQLYFCSDLTGSQDLEVLRMYFEECIEVSRAVYGKIAYRNSTEGLLAVGEQKNHDLTSINFTAEDPFILVAEAPEKPGNIGALLRTADAANVDAVLIANPRTDLYNPNIIRSSVGCVFTNQIGMGSSAEIIELLRKNKINIYAAALQASVNYTQPNYTQPTAIVVGTEANGLQTQWLTHAAENIIIPMEGKIDSMNVSVSAGILIFEVKRQRADLK